jgi:2-polyprenyl-6-hydroxyphenyl methylase/3-demethylubiquinone-9 3-methyltransferase
MPCKICGGAAALYGVVDFHKSCGETQGLHLPLSGMPIYYRRCAGCGFLFTDAFDDWSHEQFKAHIYNSDYLAVDPEYEEVRPRRTAEIVVGLWAEHMAQTRLLDFGGGNDMLCSVLRQKGFPVALTYDPMVPQYAQRPEGKFDLVTCFETFEHLPDPNAGISQILECVTETGLILYSTLVQPTDFDKRGVSWWYVGPRNGHISIYSREALSIAWGRHGYKHISFNDSVHLAFCKLPAFLAHLQAQADAASTRGAPPQAAAAIRPAA